MILTLPLHKFYFFAHSAFTDGGDDFVLIDYCSCFHLYFSFLMFALFINEVICVIAIALSCCSRVLCHDFY